MLKRIIGLLILIIFLIIAFELILNFSHYETDILFQYQPDYGWSHLANKKFWYQGHLFSINQDGFRDINHSVKKPTDVIRIAFIGSHYLRGTNSSFDKIATTIIERKWNEMHPERKIEVFNFTIPKYNLNMAYFLIKKYSQKYAIDYFFYVFDPQKDPRIIAGDSDIINYSPSLIINNQGKVNEKINFIKAPFVSPSYKSLKIYQFLRTMYSNIKLGETDSVASDSEIQEAYEPYPEIFLDNVASSTLGTIEKIAKIMDYTIQNCENETYFLFIPPQHFQFFDIYEKQGNLDYFNNEKFKRHLKEIHNQSYESFEQFIYALVEKADDNHFNPDNLEIRLKPVSKFSEKLIFINKDKFYSYLDNPAAEGFMHNWHRRDSGQQYLAEILLDDVLPRLLLE